MTDDTLSKLLADLKGQTNPPVDKWNPPFCGDLDIRIDVEGQWYYMGSPIGREKLVKLFASVLRKDADGKTYLVTPVEKIGITVDDSPFVGVDIEPLDGLNASDGPVFVMTTNVGDQIPLDDQHRLRLDQSGGEPRPYVPVRGRLEARINRATYYRMVDLALNADGLDGDDLYLTSAGVRHWLGKVSDA